MKIIAGLGNPGREYENTPHSVGFETVDAIAGSIGAAWEEKRAFKALVARGTLRGERVLLVKPLTWMNLSGNAVAPAVAYSNARPQDLVVVQDDIDLPLGKIRIRRGGSCGGHNGIRNIIERLGSPDFIRVKIGVGKDRSDVVGHVLGKFDPASRKIVDEAVKIAAEAACEAAASGPDKAMNLYNGKGGGA